jgi:hypothetical protein
MEPNHRYFQIQNYDSYEDFADDEDHDRQFEDFNDEDQQLGGVRLP